MFLDSKTIWLLNRYYKKAQAMGLGDPALSFDELKQQASFYKTKIQNAEKKPTPKWKEPGNKTLIVLDKLISGSELDTNLKDLAKLDISDNFRNIFTEAEINQFDKILDSYGSSKYSQKQNKLIKTAAAADLFKNIILNEETMSATLNEFKLGLDLSLTALKIDSDISPEISSAYESQVNLIKSALNEIQPDIEELDEFITGFIS